MTQNVWHSITRLAGVDLLAHQFLFLKLDTNGNVVLAGDGDTAVCGVMQNKAASGEPCTVAVLGIAKVIAGGNVTASHTAAVGSGGKAVDAGLSKVGVGIFMDSGVANDLVRVILQFGPGQLTPAS